MPQTRWPLSFNKRDSNAFERHNSLSDDELLSQCLDTTIKTKLGFKTRYNSEMFGVLLLVIMWH